MTDFGRRLHLVTGKGGVGKSTVARKIGTACIERRPLLVELGARNAHSDFFGVKVTHTPTEVSSGLFALSIDPELAVQDYLKRNLKLGALSRPLAGNRLLSRFLKSAPGVHEVATYALIHHYLEHTEFDPIVVDLDATGHALMFLELPKVLNQFLGNSRMRRGLDALSEQMHDRSLTSVHLVSTAEAVVVGETLELANVLREEHHLPPTHIWANRVPRAELSGSELGVLSGDSADVLLGRWDSARASEADAQLERLASLTAHSSPLEVRILREET